MNALLLCAGLGTRFRPITDKVAKPALPFLNIPLLGYSLFYLEQMAPGSLVLNTHHLPQTIESVAKPLTGGQPYSVQFSYEPMILGSGGGILNAKSKLIPGDEGTFFVSNGDEVFFFAHEEGFQPLLNFHKKRDALATLLTTNHPEAGKALGGVWAEPDGTITQLGGFGDKPGAQHFTGVYIFSSRIFSYMPESGAFHIFTDCLHKAMAAGEQVLAFHDPELLWLDMTSEREFTFSTQKMFAELETDSVYARTQAAIWARYQHKLERIDQKIWLGPDAQFEGMLDPAAHLLMGAESHISSGVEVSGHAVLGTGALFSQGFVESSSIAAGVHIHELVALRKQLVVG